MAAASNRAPGGMRAAGVALAAALAGLFVACPATAQQIVEQPVWVPPAESRIETVPLPPIGDAAGEDSDSDAGNATLPQPRFLRVPPAEGEAADGRAGGPADARGQAAGAAGQQDGEWQRSPDGRFYRAPASDAPADPAGPARVVPIDPPATGLRAGARLRELDKMTGQTKTFEIGVGEAREVDRLRIRLEACRSPEDNDTHGTMAFLKVWDTKYPEAEAFSGWMFAESPALSALDHPRYDLWVISCTTAEGVTSASRQ